MCVYPVFHMFKTSSVTFTHHIVNDIFNCHHGFYIITIMIAHVLHVCAHGHTMCFGEANDF